MTNKEFVIERFPDARVVYGASNKPSVMSDSFTYQSKTGDTVDEAWHNASNDIKSLNFQKRFFNDEEIVRYFFPNHDIKLSIDLNDEAKYCKHQYEFWSKKKWDDV